MEKAEKLILTAGPSITEKEIAYVNDAVSNGWNEKWNEYIIKFQEEFSRYIGVKHALATSSCTGAMHLGLKSFAPKKSDRPMAISASTNVTPPVKKFGEPFTVPKSKFCIVMYLPGDAPGKFITCIMSLNSL